MKISTLAKIVIIGSGLLGMQPAHTATSKATWSWESDRNQSGEVSVGNRNGHSQTIGVTTPNFVNIAGDGMNPDAIYFSHAFAQNGQVHLFNNVFNTWLVIAENEFDEFFEFQSMYPLTPIAANKGVNYRPGRVSVSGSWTGGVDRDTGEETPGVLSISLDNTALYDSISGTGTAALSLGVRNTFSGPGFRVSQRGRISLARSWSVNIGHRDYTNLYVYCDTSMTDWPYFFHHSGAGATLRYGPSTSSNSVGCQARVSWFELPNGYQFYPGNSSQNGATVKHPDGTELSTGDEYSASHLLFSEELNAVFIGSGLKFDLVSGTFSEFPVETPILLTVPATYYKSIISDGFDFNVEFN